MNGDEIRKLKQKLDSNKILIHELDDARDILVSRCKGLKRELAKAKDERDNFKDGVELLKKELEKYKNWPTCKKCESELYICKEDSKKSFCLWCEHEELQQQLARLNRFVNEVIKSHENASYRVWAYRKLKEFEESTTTYECPECKRYRDLITEIKSKGFAKKNGLSDCWFCARHENSIKQFESKPELSDHDKDTVKRAVTAIVTEAISNKKGDKK